MARGQMGADPRPSHLVTLSRSERRAIPLDLCEYSLFFDGVLIFALYRNSSPSHGVKNGSSLDPDDLRERVEMLESHNKQLEDYILQLKYLQQK